jgi:hypothetical protein
VHLTHSFFPMLSSVVSFYLKLMNAIELRRHPHLGYSPPQTPTYTNTSTINFSINRPGDVQSLKLTVRISLQLHGRHDSGTNVT